MAAAGVEAEDAPEDDAALSGWAFREDEVSIEGEAVDLFVVNLSGREVRVGDVGGVVGAGFVVR